VTRGAERAEGLIDARSSARYTRRVRPFRQLKRVLIVEDDAALRPPSRRVTDWGARVLEAGSTGGQALLAAAPDLLLVDLHLPDEPAFTVIEAAAQLWPKPLCVAISGRASPEQAFRLAQLGVRAYVGKPFSLDELQQAVERAYREAPRLESLIAACVGRVPLRELQEHLRKVMVLQALALSEGSRSETARLLAVSRQAIQQMLRGRITAPPSSSITDPRATRVPQASLRWRSTRELRLALTRYCGHRRASAGSVSARLLAPMK
jgi:DNA-binding NtrC family response regulator